MSETEALTVEKAVAILAKIAERHASAKLVVPYEAGQMMIGPTPAKQVLSLHEGFDWDYGSVLINVGPLLQAPSVEIQRQHQVHKDAIDAIGRIALQLRTPGQSADEKITRIEALIKSFGGNGRARASSAPAAA